ncbi:MAG TPA: helicase-related protein, partial [Acidimicrobiia bacterium]|nr:helicase-related protein [Acidimicrobiia bacterium]
MAVLEDLTPKTRVTGLVAGLAVTVVAVEPHGPNDIEVTYRADDGTLGSRLVSREAIEQLTIESEGRPWSLDADGDLFKLASEARRIQLAHLFDPFIAVETSTIEPLPHQIEAVYQRMLPLQPLRFLLADDPGAGKTIMAGLYIRELMIRGDVVRCLIIAPGSLVEQWQDEMRQKFGLTFTQLSRDLVEASATGNPFVEHNQLIARVHQLSRNDDLLAKLRASEWDLIIVDEAHKMSAHEYFNEVDKTKLYRLGEELNLLTRHLLLMTATPHSGKDEDFRLFMALLDPDRFAGTHGNTKPDVSDLMRRYVKESLKTFDGKRLFPERIATSVNYELSRQEQDLYEQVTTYVQTGMEAAERLQQGGDKRRGLIVGFALTALQRRLASSPEAIYRSIQRRKERLQKRRAELQDITDGRRRPVDTLPKIGVGELEDFDFDAYEDDELEQLEDEAIDEATAAATIVELDAEIVQLEALEKLAYAVRATGNDKKWEELSRILQSEAMLAPDGSKRKIIVFTEHRDTLSYLHTKIRTLFGSSDAVVAIHGGVKRDDRRRIQAAFTTDPAVQVLVATDAAGEGVNLQRANLMVNYDLPWNPNRIEQRFGRIHRIGQKEVCHLWNLVAYQTREGKVFERLFAKIKEMRDALGNDSVYDVLGDSQVNKSLVELLIRAIRYGEDPDVRARMEEVIDQDIGSRISEAVAERAMSSEILNQLQVTEIRDAMERAKARKLQPGFIQAFFKAAFDHLGGRIPERESGRFEITRVPASVRSREREVAAGGFIGTAYERVTFSRDLVRVDAKPTAELLAPGHPLLSAVIDNILEKHGELLRKGTVLIDPDDPSAEPRALVYLEHAVHDGRSDRPISQRFQFVEITRSGATIDPGPEPYLLYRAATPEERERLSSVVGEEWLARSLNDIARTYAVANLAGPHFQEVRDLTVARVERVRKAVEERLATEIRFWDAKAAELKTKELQGKKVKGGITSGHARVRADEMEARRLRRLRQLDQEQDVSSRPPVVVAGALVVPHGLLHVGGTGPDNGGNGDWVDQRAVEAVIRAEIAAGRLPTEMVHNNPGYDIMSVDPRTGIHYFIEVKGRIEGMETVTVKTRQIRMAINNPERFR